MPCCHFYQKLLVLYYFSYKYSNNCANLLFLGRDLGKGTFGKVKVGTHTLTGEKVAIKVLEKDKIIDVNDVDRVAREIKILKIVRHPVVVQLYEIVET